MNARAIGTRAHVRDGCIRVGVFTLSLMNGVPDPFRGTAAVGPEETRRRRAFFALAFALCGILHAHSAFLRVVFALLATVLSPSQSALFVRHLCNLENTG